MKHPRTFLCNMLLAATLAASSAVAAAETFTRELPIALDGIQSFGELNSPFNTVLTRLLPTDAHIVGLGWALTLTAQAPSWLDDVKLRFSDASVSLPLDLRPGEGDLFAGTATYGSGGIVDLVALGYDFRVGGDGALLIQVYETLDDVVGADAAFAPGSFLSIRYETATAAVPEPSPYLLLLVSAALLAACRLAAGRAPKP